MILTGGYSRRMGQDKGGLNQTGHSAVRQWHDLLTTVVPESVISLRPDQLAGSSASHYAGLECVLDESPGRGPLGAIVSVARQHPERALFIVAVDLLGLNRSGLERLSAARKQDIDLVVAARPTGPRPNIHPLCAIWEPPALTRAITAWQNGIRSPMRVIESLPRDRICLIELAFTDANTPADHQRNFAP